MDSISLDGKPLTIDVILQLYQQHYPIQLAKQAHINLSKSCDVVQATMAAGQTVYGINTGFGKLATTKITDEELSLLQRRLIESHATGVGDSLNDAIVRLITLLKCQSLVQGYSGIQQHTVEKIIELHNLQIYPRVPAKGSVGASGDLAPLAHFALPLIGQGEVEWKEQLYDTHSLFTKLHISPVDLGPKEGLALINGTQVSTAIALAAILQLKNIFAAAIIAGGLSVDAAKGSDVPFNDKISKIRGHRGQIIVAELLTSLLQGSKIRDSHRECSRVQDPYSLRCQPQVMGALLEQINFCQQRLVQEANAVTDNPLIFSEDELILSGGNFHAEPVALACDSLAVVLAEMANLSERRLALLMDPQQSGLPAFLVENSGVNSGFMNAQVTAAALTSENKMLSHPASVDTIPTSANQEDHVSMACHAAYRLLTMTENTAHCVAIELLAAAQGIRFHQQPTSKILQGAMEILEKVAKPLTHDRYMANEITQVKQIVMTGDFFEILNQTNVKWDSNE